MKASKNPFFFRELSLNDPFCDREVELEKLVSYANGLSNVLVYSPRRFGKTSLVKRVQNEIVKSNGIAVFSDFFGVTSTDDVAGRIARSIFQVTQSQKSLFEKAMRFIKSFRPVLKPDENGTLTLTVEPASLQSRGIDLLDDTMTSIDKFVKDSNQLVSIVFDEFQEITELPECHQIEGTLRTHIQHIKASFFFVGSRRRILLAMFNDSKRPFFRSAINFELNALPRDDLSEFIARLFKHGSKQCSIEIAKKISDLTLQHPYYSQKLSFFIYELSKDKITENDLVSSMKELIQSESPIFEATLSGLAPRQIALLKAIAKEPTASIFSIDYMGRHGLGSTGGAQGALKRLTALDLVETTEDKVLRLVDPLFREWLLSK